MSLSVPNSSARIVRALRAASFVWGGAQKRQNLDGTMALFGQWVLPGWFSGFIGGARLLGGVGLRVPRTVRPAGLGLLPMMIGAVLTRAVRAVSVYGPVRRRRRPTGFCPHRGRSKVLTTTSRTLPASDRTEPGRHADSETALKSPATWPLACPLSYCWGPRLALRSRTEARAVYSVLRSCASVRIRTQLVRLADRSAASGYMPRLLAGNFPKPLPPGRVACLWLARPGYLCIIPYENPL